MITATESRLVLRNPARPVRDVAELVGRASDLRAALVRHAVGAAEGARHGEHGQARGAADIAHRRFLQAQTSLPHLHRQRRPKCLFSPHKRLGCVKQVCHVDWPRWRVRLAAFRLNSQWFDCQLSVDPTRKLTDENHPVALIGAWKQTPESGPSAFDPRLSLRLPLETSPKQTSRIMIARCRTVAVWQRHPITTGVTFPTSEVIVSSHRSRTRLIRVRAPRGRSGSWFGLSHRPGRLPDISTNVTGFSIAAKWPPRSASPKKRSPQSAARPNDATGAPARPEHADARRSGIGPCGIPPAISRIASQ